MASTWYRMITLQIIPRRNTCIDLYMYMYMYRSSNYMLKFYMYIRSGVLFSYFVRKGISLVPVI